MTINLVYVETYQAVSYLNVVIRHSIWDIHTASHVLASGSYKLLPRVIEVSTYHLKDKNQHVRHKCCVSVSICMSMPIHQSDLSTGDQRE